MLTKIWPFFLNNKQSSNLQGFYLCDTLYDRVSLISLGAAGKYFL